MPAVRPPSADLKGRPVVVLSNNDGCVIARSAEAAVCENGRTYLSRRLRFFAGVVALAVMGRMPTCPAKRDGHPEELTRAAKLQYR